MFFRFAFIVAKRKDQQMYELMLKHAQHTIEIVRARDTCNDSVGGCIAEEVYGQCDCVYARARKEGVFAHANGAKPGSGRGFELEGVFPFFEILGDRPTEPQLIIRPKQLAERRRSNVTHPTIILGELLAHYLPQIFDVIGHKLGGVAVARSVKRVYDSIGSFTAFGSVVTVSSFVTTSIQNEIENHPRPAINNTKHDLRASIWYFKVCSSNQVVVWRHLLAVV